MTALANRAALGHWLPPATRGPHSPMHSFQLPSSPTCCLEHPPETRRPMMARTELPSRSTEPLLTATAPPPLSTPSPPLPTSSPSTRSPPPLSTPPLSTPPLPSSTPSPPRPTSSPTPTEPPRPTPCPATAHQPTTSSRRLRASQAVVSCQH